MDFDAARRNMVDSQIRPNDVTDPDIVAAFLKTPREIFTPKSKMSLAYSELEIETSDGRWLWRPRDFAKLLEAADPKPDDIALVIGAGAGYEAAVAGELVETVIGLESDAHLVDRATERLSEIGLERVVFVEGALEEGLASQGPFDLILVNGMVATVPQAWTDQLAEGGRLAVVVQADRDLGKARIMTRAGDVVSSRTAFDATPPRWPAFDPKPAFSF
ncbi:MAG: protein-L-isoaspartate O-methyltransferase [Pseudomonadota bacterium]